MIGNALLFIALFRGRKSAKLRTRSRRRIYGRHHNFALMSNDNVNEQLRAAIQVLEQAASDRTLLAQISPEEYSRLLKAAGNVFVPDPKERRRFVKARIRQRKAEKVQRQESVLNQTGIRELRRRPVFTTPNPLPAPSTEPREIGNDPDFRDKLEPQHCYVYKRHNT